MTVYEARVNAADGSILLTATDRLPTVDNPGAGGALRYRFEAATHEVANAIHALRMGWAPYRPDGNLADCPDCGATYYPNGSGECWRCMDRKATASGSVTPKPTDA